MKIKIALLAVMVVVIMAPLLVGQAAAQTETPQPTATALSDSDTFNLDGRDLVIDHHVSLGEIATVIGLLLITAILVIRTIFTMVTTYLK